MRYLRIKLRDGANGIKNKKKFREEKIVQYKKKRKEIERKFGGRSGQAVQLWRLRMVRRVSQSAERILTSFCADEKFLGTVFPCLAIESE